MTIFVFYKNDMEKVYWVYINKATKRYFRWGTGDVVFLKNADRFTTENKLVGFSAKYNRVKYSSEVRRIKLNKLEENE